MTRGSQRPVRLGFTMNGSVPSSPSIRALNQRNASMKLIRQTLTACRVAARSMARRTRL